MLKKNNPSIPLYHTTTTSIAEKVLEKGLKRKPYIYHKEDAPEFLFAGREALQKYCPLQKESIFFIKKPIKMGFPSEVILMIDNASEIPCRCYQADYYKSMELYKFAQDEALFREVDSNIALSTKEYQEKEKKLGEEYSKTFKPLSKKIEHDTVEVMCPCEIPPELIKEYKEE